MNSRRGVATGLGVAAVAAITLSAGALAPGTHAPAKTYLADVPGATDPRVTQENVAATICTAGYTATVRPPLAVTETIKRRLMRAHGYTDTPGDFELDHEIPLEVGGAPSDLNNLWLERQPHARQVDKVENRLHRDVCAGRLTLAQAQAQIVALKHRSG